MRLVVYSHENELKNEKVGGTGPMSEYELDLFRMKIANKSVGHANPEFVVVLNVIPLRDKCKPKKRVGFSEGMTAAGDKSALDEIANLLDGEPWDGNLITQINNVVSLTGRGKE